MTPEQFEHAAGECIKALEEFALFIKKDQRSKEALGHLKEIVAMAKVAIPSGQVVEDVALLDRTIEAADTAGRVNMEPERAALSSLATKVQGYEAAINGCHAARWGGTMCGHCSACVSYWETEASIQAANYERAKGERDAAVADNAALLGHLKRMVAEVRSQEKPDVCAKAAYIAADAMLRERTK